MRAHAPAYLRSFRYVFLIDHGEKTPSYRNQTSDFVQTKAQTSIPMPITMVWHEKSKHKTLLKIDIFLTLSVVGAYVLLPPKAYIITCLTTIFRCRFWRFCSGCGAVAWNVRVRLAKKGSKDLSCIPDMSYKHK